MRRQTPRSRRRRVSTPATGCTACGGRIDMTAAPSLLPHHADLSRASAILPAVADARGYFSALTAAEVRRLGFAQSQALAPALVIPTFTTAGHPGIYLLRPDKPRVNG